MKHTYSDLTNIEPEVLKGTQERLWRRFILNASMEEDLNFELHANAYNAVDIEVIKRVVEAYRQTGVVQM